MFYNNLKNVCSEQGVAISKAVVEAGGKVGSIDGWKKGAYPSSKILEQLCLRLNVSADRLLFGKEKSSSSELSDEEEELLTIFRNVSERGKGELIGYARRMIETCSPDVKENVS